MGLFGGGSKGVLSDVGVGSCDDSTGSNADAVLSGAKSVAVRELVSSGVAGCWGSGKASSPRSCRFKRSLATNLSKKN